MYDPFARYLRCAKNFILGISLPAGVPMRCHDCGTKSLSNLEGFTGQAGFIICQLEKSEKSTRLRRLLKAVLELGPGPPVLDNAKWN
jgi:hypothetical protein